MISQINIPINLLEELKTYKIFPSDFVFYINSHCNLRCKHCYIGNELLKQQIEIQTDSVIRLLNNLEIIDRITILGGEPSMHSDFPNLMNQLALLNIEDLRVTTNLSFLDFHYNLSEAAINKSTFCVSLDGHNNEVHDYIRGKGTFSNIISNLKTIIKLGYNIEITHTLTNINQHFILDFIDLLRNLGIKNLNLHKMSMHGNALMNRDLYLSPSDYRNIITVITESKKENGEMFLRYPLLFVTDLELNELCNSSEYHNHTVGSFYGKGHRIVFYPDGKLYISSEYFGTDSFVGNFDANGFHFNADPKNEFLFFQDNPNGRIDYLYAEQSGDETYPNVLSVSFKKHIRL